MDDRIRDIFIDTKKQKTEAKEVLKKEKKKYSWNIIKLKGRALIKNMFTKKKYYIVFFINNNMIESIELVEDTHDFKYDNKLYFLDPSKSLRWNKNDVLFYDVRNVKPLQFRSDPSKDLMTPEELLAFKNQHYLMDLLKYKESKFSGSMFWIFIIIGLVSFILFILFSRGYL